MQDHVFRSGRIYTQRDAMEYAVVCVQTAMDVESQTTERTECSNILTRWRDPKIFPRMQSDIFFNVMKQKLFQDHIFLYLPYERIIQERWGAPHKNALTYMMVSSLMITDIVMSFEPRVIASICVVLSYPMVGLQYPDPYLW